VDPDPNLLKITWHLKIYYRKKKKGYAGCISEIMTDPNSDPDLDKHVYLKADPEQYPKNNYRSKRRNQQLIKFIGTYILL
jgi:hypothetical protein